MTVFRLRPGLIIGVLSALTFVLLLFIRLGLLEEGGADHRRIRPFHAHTHSDRETWINIFQHEQKIGYVHRQFFRTDEGYRIAESVVMQINMMGMVQDVRFKTDGTFLSDLTLSSFDFELQSSLFSFKVRGIRKGKVLTLITGKSGSEQKYDLPFEKETSLSIGMFKALAYEDLKPGEKRTFQILDPATLSLRPVNVLVLSEETIPILGRQERAKKLSVEFMGVSQFSWMGEDGTVLKEEGSLGIRLEQVTKEEALSRVTASPGIDLAEIVSIPSNKIIQDATGIRELRIRLFDVNEGEVFLNGGRQLLKDGDLTIRKESVLKLPPFNGKTVLLEGKAYLESTPFIQSDHPVIQAKAKEIVSPGDSPFEKAKKLVKWVNENIQKKPVLSIPNAIETLQNRVGDCNEHAVLLAALARASGIPAQVEAGLVYQKGRFYYHAWNILYLGTWITADSVMCQLPADVTHIRLVRGTEKQIDLIRVIGRVRLEVLSAY